MNKIADIGDTFFGSGGNRLSDPENLGPTFVRNIISASITIAGVVLLFFLISGGIAMIAGAGNNDPQKIAQGKKAATSAIIGFIVVIAAYWIVKLIELMTGLVLL